MKQHLRRVLLGCLLFVMAIPLIAQPPNDACSSAQVVTPNGTCIPGTTTGASDLWVGSVGCQTGGNHNEVWYTFTATQNQLNFTVNSTGIGNNVEFILANSPCGTCACSFVIEGSVCGPAPLTDSISGLTIGATYYFTISSSGSDGGFTVCPNNIAAAPIPGQDCPTATNLCDTSSFAIGNIADGNGSVSGGGSEEDVAAMTCFGTSERQSQWYLFTCSQTGTIEFNINPNVSGDDYDFALFDITTSGCALNSGSAPVVACNWSGCTGSTGISSAATSEPGVRTGGPGCMGGPAAFDQTPPTITCGNTYALLIDNFTTSNSGFNFTWGGATNGMTAMIGPRADFSVVMTDCDADVTNNAACPNFTYNWAWGDGTFSSGANPGTHTYTAGNYTITLTITDPLGCTSTTSLNVQACSLPFSKIGIAGEFRRDAVELHVSVPTTIGATSYEVQRSADGEDFETISGQEGLDGQSDIAETLEDKDWHAGLSYYRVVAYGANNQAYHSDVRAIVTRDPFTAPVFHPNPATDEMVVAFSAATRQSVSIQLMNAKGQVVRVESVQAAPGRNAVRLDMHDLPRGVYLVRVRSGSRMHVGKVLK